LSLGVLAVAAGVAVACEEPPPEDPSQTQTTYQNGYPQTIAQANTQQRPNGTAPQAAATGPVSYGPTAATTEPAATTAPPAATTTAPAPTAAATVAPSPAPMQTTPVPVGVQALPPPAAAAAAPTAPPAATMAVPGPGAFQCTSDAQCLLGRCNVRYGRCAYPCKNSALDCKQGNVCTPAGLCMPRIAGGVGM
jgi:hypothetical protein